MKVRAPYVVALLTIVAATALLRALAQGEPVGTAHPLHQLPLALGPWQGETDYFEPEVLAGLRVDDYILRRYQAEQGGALWLYVGYWAAQRLGQTRVHSPSVCLPGSGWVITSAAVVPIRLPGGGTIAVNSDVIQKGTDRQLVLYWYQIHGRVVAKELRAVATLAWTSLLEHRSDEALVRVNAPISGSVQRTLRQEAAFVQAMFPSLARLLPR